MSELRTDDEIETYIASLAGGMDEFRELVTSGRLAGRRGERGKQYLDRLDAKEADDRAERQTSASERQAQSGAVANWISGIALLVSVISLIVSLRK